MELKFSVTLLALTWIIKCLCYESEPKEKRVFNTIILFITIFLLVLKKRNSLSSSSLTNAHPGQPLNLPFMLSNLWIAAIKLGIIFPSLDFHILINGGMKTVGRPSLI